MAFDSLVLETGSSGADFVIKTETEAYYYSNPTFTQVLDVDYPATTVRGLVFLDGTYYVMTPEGTIHGSAINNPASWSALNVISVQNEPDRAVMLARQLNLIVAFGEYSTEFFYDAANPTGSPLGSYASAFLEIGCANANSVAYAENTIFFMSSARHKGRSIQILEGTNPRVVSTPNIDRLLDADDLANISSAFLKFDGHGYYILTLGTLGVTLAYDLTANLWAVWTILKPLQFNTRIGTPVRSATNQLTIPLVNDTGTNELFEKGAPISLTFKTGGVEHFIIREKTETSIVLDFYKWDLIDDDTLILDFVDLVTLYTEQPFSLFSTTTNGNKQYAQDTTTGAVYALRSDSFTDGLAPINMKIRTSQLTGETNDFKFFNSLDLVGDRINDSAYIRYSDDDYRTWSKYRAVNLNLERSFLSRLGRARRRSFEIVSLANNRVRFSALHLTLLKGST